MSHLGATLSESQSFHSSLSVGSYRDPRATMPHLKAAMPTRGHRSDLRGRETFLHSFVIIGEKWKMFCLSSLHKILSPEEITH